MTDYYAVLGISEDSEATKINAAYRKLALQCHPDRNRSKEAVDKFNKVAEAFETLSNPNKRKKYDQIRRKNGVGSSGGTTVLRFTSNNANDMFEKIFGQTDIEDIIKNASSKVNVVHHAPARRTLKPKLKPVLKPVLKPELKPKQVTVPPQDDTVTEVDKPIICSLEDLYTGKRRIVKLEGYTKMVIVEVPAGCTEDQQLPVKNRSLELGASPMYRWRIQPARACQPLFSQPLLHRVSMRIMAALIWRWKGRSFPRWPSQKCTARFGAAT